MAEIKLVLGEWNAAMALRTPAPAPTKAGKKRFRGIGDPEYIMLTDGTNDGARASHAMLSYCLESRTMTITLLVARFGSNGEWMCGSQPPPRERPDDKWSLILGEWVAVQPPKHKVDDHLAIRYGA